MYLKIFWDFFFLLALSTIRQCLPPSHSAASSSSQPRRARYVGHRHCSVTDCAGTHCHLQKAISEPPNPCPHRTVFVTSLPHPTPPLKVIYGVSLVTSSALQAGKPHSKVFTAAQLPAI